MQITRANLWYLLNHKSFLIALLIINLLGTVYGYYWYGWQLAITKPIFYIFVPDSPTASLFFCFVLIAWIFGKSWPLMEVLALVTLVKYGLWADVMNIWTLVETGSIGWQGWMLVGSHFAMAVQAILYMKKYVFTYWHVVIAAVWTLHNDVIDYVFGQMPMYGDLVKYTSYIGYFTFWLSIACILLAIFSIRWRKYLPN
ncbi:DUF1405 domain-containing protein [Lysinibacillus sp. ZYM-1]|uniref:DUF1405 domain-containing protein n=1 Tax=Lysinibacillus sp. ZYM-1 TaxID=1681184 RepID=UPI0006CEA490|nr:DUF1405 domain-containing protein [Lysinibacillus sp. ZYM-1]KPN95338.1 hypothetical protein AO843_03935 [Lysinibacillus sp. ZYM-1]